MTDFTITTRDALYNEEDRLDVWSKLTIISRFNKTGTFNLEIPREAFSSRLITPRTGIIVRRNIDNKIIFSGSVSSDFRKTKNTIKISGKDDNYLLEQPCRPTPSQNFGPFTDEYFVNTGIASSVMIDLVNRNIGPAAPSSWKIPPLIMATDPVIGSAITVRGRFDPLIILLAGLAATPIATGLGFKLQQSDTINNTLEFSIYVPQDRTTAGALFKTELNNILDYEYAYNTPQANYFYVAGGDGFGTDRTVVEGGDSDSITAVGRIIAQFIDKRGVVNPGELNQALAEAIATSVTSETITVEPNDVPTLQFGREYNLGDLVSATIDEVTYTKLIREVEIDFPPTGGQVIKPMLADPNGSNDSSDAQHVATLENRLSNIERNYSVPENSIVASMLHDTMRWEVGDIKITARAAAQPGWILCNGSPISRITYSSLFLQIGTLYGIGNGSTTFNLPDSRSRFPIGGGAAYTRGDSGNGTGIGSHTHSHSHGGGSLVWTHTHTGQPHTHPGSHSHGMKNHTHNINHDHDSFESGRETDFGSDTFGRTAGSSTGTGHRHNINVPSLGSTNSGSPSDNTTDSDTNAHSASYSGSASGPTTGVSPWSGGSDPDSTAGSDSGAVIPPYITYNYTIFTGVV